MLRRIRSPRVQTPLTPRCIRRHRDRPVRDRPSRAGAGLWFLRLPKGAAKRTAGRALGDLLRRAGDALRLAPGVERAVGIHAQHIALAGAPQRHLDLADAIDAVRRDEGERHLRARSRARSWRAPLAAWSQSRHRASIICGTCAFACARGRPSSSSADKARGR